MIKDKVYGKSEDGTEFRYTMDLYDIGDTLLEGVLCDVVWDLTTNPIMIKALEVHPHCTKYFNQLNVGMWMDNALIYAQETLEEILADPDPDTLEDLMPYTNANNPWLEF